MNRQRLIIAGGGTGGHLYPGIAVAQYLKDKDIECFFIVSDRGLERRVLTQLGYKFYEQKQTPLKGVGFGTKIRSVFRLMKEIMVCYRLVKRHDIVLMTGGFAAAAPGLIAIMKGLRLYMHEQNSVMGFTNRLFAGGCDKVFLSFPDTINVQGNTEIAGNPVREEFTKIPPVTKAGKKILVLGGSQGSRIVNNLMADSAPVLLERGYSITHQTGGALLGETEEKYRAKGLLKKEGLTLTDYIENVAEALAEADIVIARSGSGTVFEVMNAGRYAIYIPFAKAADNHQYHNAMFAEREGIAKVVTEESATVEKIIETIEDYEKNSDLYIEKLNSVKKYRSAQIIAGGMNIG